MTTPKKRPATRKPKPIAPTTSEETEAQLPITPTRKEKGSALVLPEPVTIRVASGPITADVRIENPEKLIEVGVYALVGAIGKAIGLR